MPSPFPGMDPYLERDGLFHEFHQRFIPRLAELLLPKIAPKYLATLDSHVYLHEFAADQRHLIGRFDVAVTHVGGELSVQSPGTATQSVLGTVPVPVLEEVDSFVELRERDGMEVVTVIELLSLANKKSGSDREQYLGKRAKYLKSGVHLVEIDLLRRGPRMPQNGLPPCDYTVMVSRAERRPSVELFPIRLRDRLPIIPIPLKVSDPDAKLDLQAVFDSVYDGAGYQYYIHKTPPEPPFQDVDEEWVRLRATQ
jgi:hypothetical protein